MKRCLALLFVFLLLAPMTALAQTPFEDVCSLLAQAVTGSSAQYLMREQALDTIDAVGAGTLSLQEGIDTVAALSEQMRSLPRNVLSPSEDVKAFMLERGLSIADFQAVADDSATMAPYNADVLDGYIELWKASGNQLPLNTELERWSLSLEKELDFIAINTVLLPQNQVEADAVQALLIDPTDWMKATGLPWEWDYSLCEAKYNTLYNFYTDSVSNLEIDISQKQAELDAALAALEK